MRVKYLSAIYIFIPLQKKDANNSLKFLHLEFELENISQVLSFVDFTSNLPKSLNYYYIDTQKPFCKTYIHLKLKMLLDMFPGKMHRNNLRPILIVK